MPNFTTTSKMTTSDPSGNLICRITVANPANATPENPTGTRTTVYINGVEVSDEAQTLEASLPSETTPEAAYGDGRDPEDNVDGRDACDKKNTKRTASPAYNSNGSQSEGPEQSFSNAYFSGFSSGQHGRWNGGYYTPHYGANSTFTYVNGESNYWTSYTGMNPVHITNVGVGNVSQTISINSYNDNRKKFSKKE
ncbi:hypothetical protein BDN70DRAFT_898538 [Pholiota conissans]|uniref:Uncharacterized protein n=1 Tax=Pholiota conissans TaxID=109636 RepID=A0A9P6CVR0_9AGAR|nr:hypothetical protein BDN70DRAFT_898538 [Pholiota conissans]